MPRLPSVRFRLRGALLPVVLTLSPWFAASAIAATFTATNCNDAGAGSLRQAVTDANNNAGVDSVNFNVTCSRINLLSQIIIAESVDIVGPGWQSMTIGNATGRALSLEPASPAPNFQTVTISGVRFSGSAGTNGGAVYSLRTNLGLRQTVFAANEAAETGGALQFASGPEAGQRTLDIDRCTFVGNGRTGSAGGGAIFAHDALVSIRGSLFRQNGNQQTTGGAIYASDSSVVFDASALTANSALRGGAIAVEPVSGTSSLTVLATTLLNNVANNSDPSQYGGGAIWSTRSELRVSNSTFYGNTVQGTANGAAIDAHGGSLRSLNNTFAANRVESTASPNGTIFAMPRLAGGDDDEVAMTVYLRNTVVTTTAGLDAARRFDVLLPSIEGSVGTIDIAASFVTSQRVGTVDAADARIARLGAIASNGGVETGATGASEPVYTIMSAGDSPLRNAGSASAASELTTDQRGAGFPRIVGGAVDIGSIEGAQAIVIAEALPVPASSPWGLMLLAVLTAGFSLSSIHWRKP